MCLATPVKITKIEGEFAKVISEGKEFEVSLQLTKDLKVGDWVLTHGDLVLSKLPDEEAHTILDMIRRSGCHCESTS